MTESSYQLTDQVRAYLREKGDTNVVFECFARKKRMPSRDAHLCSSLQDDGEVLLLLGPKGLYLLPSERLHNCRIVEMILHIRCGCPDFLVELVSHSNDGVREVRYVAIPSEKVMQQFVTKFKRVVPTCRFLFHELEFSMAAADTVVAKLNSRVSNYRARKEALSRSARTNVRSFGFGRFGDAAESLEAEIQQLMSETEWALEQVQLEEQENSSKLLADSKAGRKVQEGESEDKEPAKNKSEGASAQVIHSL